MVVELLVKMGYSASHEDASVYPKAAQLNGPRVSGQYAGDYCENRFQRTSSGMNRQHRGSALLELFSNRESVIIIYLAK